MKTFLILVPFLIVSLKAESDLTRLRQKILKDYNVDLRPVIDDNDTTTVRLAYYIKHILQLDEKSETLTTQGIIAVSWTDQHLVWNPTEFGNTTRINLGDHEIWQPDIFLFYSAGKNSLDQGRDTLLTVLSNGRVVWYPEANYDVPCQTDYKYFPYDQHKCELEFGSWSHDGDSLHLITREDFKMEFDKVTGSEWKLVAYTYNTTMYYMATQYPYNTINLTLWIQRTSSLYKATSAVPVVASAIFTLAGFWMELYGNSRYLIGITNFVLMSLHLINLGTTIPAGRNVPLLVQFSATVVCLSVGFLVETVILDSTKRRRGPAPEALVRLFRSMPKTFLCLEGPEEGAAPSDDVAAKQIADWRLVCGVADRLTFWIFTIIYVIVTAMLFSLT